MEAEQCARKVDRVLEDTSESHRTDFERRMGCDGQDANEDGRSRNGVPKQKKKAKSNEGKEGVRTRRVKADVMGKGEKVKWKSGQMAGHAQGI